MARLARVVAPQVPHHVTQRGNRNQPVFFSDKDRLEYLRLIRKYSQLTFVKIWAYCLMDNHVHFIAVPETKEGLTKCFQEAHRLYTRYINFREGWRGYLWQGRFSSYPMDERYLYAAVRYVERNPVSAGIVKQAGEYRWSSARARIKGINDQLLTDFYLMREIPDWKRYLVEKNDKGYKEIEKSCRVGRPLGSDAFIQDLEQLLKRKLRREKPGPKRR